jgi:hypothetical protein
MKKNLSIFLALLIGIMLSTNLMAGGINPLFSGFNSGLERLEARNGVSGSQDWELGLGQNTQSAGQFKSANVWDNSWWTIGKTYNFAYGITSSGFASFSMYANPNQTVKTKWYGMNLGNALQVHTFGGVELTYGGLTLSGDNYGYLNIDPTAGFALNGTIKFLNLDGGASGNGVTIEAGNTPIPEPGTILLLGSGFLGLGFIGWFRKRKA